MWKGISVAIRETREKVGISQKELARILGVSQSLVSQWENGSVLPSEEILERSSGILGVDLHEPTGELELKTWLRRKREQRRLSRGELAKRAGLNPLTIYYIETGRTESPQEATLERLQRLLGRFPSGVTREVKAERTLEDFEFRGPFPVSEWKENLEGNKTSCIYVFYDQVKRPVRIGETDDLRRRLKEYEQNYWWFRPPTVESFAYVKVSDSEFRRKAEKVMIRLLGGNIVFNSQGNVG